MVKAVSRLQYFFSVCFLRENLALVKELGDRSAQGRACGNLGNTHYLLGNFRQAIGYHEEVSIAEQIQSECSRLQNILILLFCL